MSTATQLDTFVDLYTDLQNRVRGETGVAARENQAKRYINIANHDINLAHGEKFWWAQREAVLITHPKYTTGTVSITKGNTNFSGVGGTAWNTANDIGQNNMRRYGKILVTGSNEVYEISGINADNAATLTAIFNNTTVTSVAYTYFEDEYALASDFLKPVDLQQFADGINLPIIGRTEMRARWPRSRTLGRPNVAAITARYNTGQEVEQRVLLHPAPDAAYRIPYRYVTRNLSLVVGSTQAEDLVNDADKPTMPKQYRHAIVLHALYHWYRDQKDDSRWEAAKMEFEQVLQRMLEDVPIGSDRPRISPRIGQYRRNAKRPWGGSGRRYDTDGRFDRFE